MQNLPENEFLSLLKTMYVHSRGMVALIETAKEKQTDFIQPVMTLLSSAQDILIEEDTPSEILEEINNLTIFCEAIHATLVLSNNVELNCLPILSNLLDCLMRTIETYLDRFGAV